MRGILKGIHAKVIAEELGVELNPGGWETLDIVDNDDDDNWIDLSDEDAEQDQEVLSFASF